MYLKSAFESLLGITQCMLTKAEEQNWDSLSTLEEERADIISKLPVKLAFATASEQNLVIDTIKKIQALDQLIRETVEPTRDDIANLLSRLKP
jgi:hypothetical protein